ncbi:hypothetical protein FCOIX_5744 [Fusarium coicis]|nr:hypothetical protein FCOIX_5744 [Fusarium coicis]
MKATRFSLTFIALALCGSGHAGPCKPRSSTALVGTTSAEATLSASTEISSATSVAESSTTDLSSIIFESFTATATATSNSQFSSSTELQHSSVTTETGTATTSVAELSAVETLTTSNIAEATTSDAPTTTTVEASVPSNLFLNPSFDESNAGGEYDGSPWALSDRNFPISVSITSDLAHTGSHSAYWSIENTAQNGVVSQTVNLEQSAFYTFSYWWYVDEDTQPQDIDCYIVVIQRSTDGLRSAPARFHPLTTPLPLKTWTERETTFNSIDITPAKMEIHVLCSDSAGSGIKVAIDDIYVAKVVT